MTIEVHTPEVLAPPIDMNNFYLRLSFGMSWEDIEKITDEDDYPMINRIVYNLIDQLDTTNRQIHKDDAYYSNWPYSEKFLRQTPRQFFDTVEQVVSLVGTEYEMPTEWTIKTIRGLNESMRPAFNLLLSMGYSLRDLTE